MRPVQFNALFRVEATRSDVDRIYDEGLTDAYRRQQREWLKMASVPPDKMSRAGLGEYTVLTSPQSDWLEASREFVLRQGNNLFRDPIGFMNRLLKGQPLLAHEKEALRMLQGVNRPGIRELVWLADGLNTAYKQKPYKTQEVLGALATDRFDLENGKIFKP